MFGVCKSLFNIYIYNWLAAHLSLMIKSQNAHGISAELTPTNCFFHLHTPTVPCTPTTHRHTTHIRTQAHSHKPISRHAH